jgi:hypothetical protein
MHFEFLESVDDVLEHGLEARPDHNIIDPTVHEQQVETARWQH